MLHDAMHDHMLFGIFGDGGLTTQLPRYSLVQLRRQGALHPDRHLRQGRPVQSLHCDANGSTFVLSAPFACDFAYIVFGGIVNGCACAPQHRAGAGGCHAAWLPCRACAGMSSDCLAANAGIVLFVRFQFGCAAYASELIEDTQN